MKNVALPLARDGRQRITGVFTFDGRVYGDTVMYVVLLKPKEAPYFNAIQLPDEGDNNAPGLEMLDITFAGFTNNGRPVYLYRSGIQGPDGWTGESGLFASIGSPTANRELGQAVTINVSQPGPTGAAGAKGAQGDRGPAGATGAAGAAGKDANMSADPRIGKYDPAKGETVRNQLDAIQNWSEGALRDGDVYIAAEVEKLVKLVAELNAKVDALAKTTPTTTTTPK